MGAETSVQQQQQQQQQRDGAGREEEQQQEREEQEGEMSCSTGTSAEVNAIREESRVVDSTTTTTTTSSTISTIKPLQKNGQILSMSSLHGLADDNILSEVGQPDSVSAVQKEEAPETMDTTTTIISKDETAPPAKGEKAEEAADANDISIVEEKVAEEKQEEANEVGFKKIFRFVGFKFTLKKDKNGEKEPVKLLKVKDKEGDDAVEDDATEKVPDEEAQETTVTEDKVDETMAATPVENGTEGTDKAAATEVPAEGAATDAADENAKEEVAEKEPESSQPSQEAPQSSFRKLLSGGLFSNLRKKASIKKTKEELEKETTAEEEIKEGDETAEAMKEEGEEAKVEQEPKEEQPATTTEEAKPEPTTEAEVNAETAPAADNAEQPKAEEEKAEGADEEKPTTETELLSSQEKAKTHGSPLKKLFNGAALKKLSTKKNKSKKEAEAKLTESVEKAAELQSSNETDEAPKAESGPSSPEDSGEHVIEGEASQIESSQETEGEVTSDGEKKKDGIIPWSSFKKLVTPKKRVKKSSESDEEAAAEKTAKSATLSSTESAGFEEKINEEEPKEDNATEEEPKTETTEKLVSSTEEPKKKMDTSVSWEALMCMGGPKKRTRKTSDSDDDETKLEEEPSPAVGEEGQEAKAEESPVLTSTEAEAEEEVVPAEGAASQQEKESAWDTLKRFVFAKNKPKVEEKAEETPEQVPSDGEVPKEESTFSLRKLFPGRKKKKAEQQGSNEMGSGEEDSDTPAVVPLSEYDTEKTEDKQEEPSEPAVTQTKASVEDRSPSWIPAIVEDGDGKHDQLSDIPEEADNAATPKSADTTIEEDDEEHSIPPASQVPPQRRLSRAEEKPVVLAISCETTPVPAGPQSKSAEIVLEAAVQQITQIPTQTSVAVGDVKLEEASPGTEFEPAIEHAESEKKTLLEPHISKEAIAICTGLETKEIAEVTLEEPVTSAAAESLTVITNSLSTEVALEEKPANLEVAAATEDLIHEAQVQQVDTTELEPATESNMPEVETATKTEEPEAEKIALIACHSKPSEMARPAELDEDTSKVEKSDPIAPTVETTVITKTVEITQPAVEIKEEEVELEKFVAVEANAPVQEIVQVVIQQSITVETTATESVIIESSPCVELEQAEIKTGVEITDDKNIAEALISIDDAVANMPAQTMQEAVLESITVDTTTTESVIIESSPCVKLERAEIKAGVEITDDKNIAEALISIDDAENTEANVIEEQSMIIAQAVIENAMDKVLEAQAEAPKLDTPTTTEESSTPVQASITTEEAIEADTEKPVITETPVICEAPTPSPTRSPKVLHTPIQATVNVPVEVIESLDGPTESEEKPTVELKQAVEVNASEETPAMEGVAELKSESPTAEDPKEVEEEESKEEAEAKSCPVVHMPVQVVLQTAQMVEDMPLKEEVVKEFNTNGPTVQDTDVNPECAGLPTLLEEPQKQTSTEAPAASQDVPVAADSTEEAEKAAAAAAADKCAQVMAQVVEVIEEAVKEIEPISSEITAAS